MAATHSFIASYTVGSGGVATITFSSIPQTYTDLLLLLSLRNDSAGAVGRTVNLTVNSNTSNYSYKMIESTGSTTYNGTGTNSSSYPAAVSVGPSATSNIFSNSSVYITNYAGSKYKAFFSNDVMENSSATAVYNHLTSGLWGNTSAISSISMVNDNGSNFVQYSTAYLYGIKNS